MNHDYSHCLDFNNSCPKKCFRAELVRDLRSRKDMVGVPISWTHCKGTDECPKVERKDEYVTLHHEDIHFIDEDAERAFYESLAKNTRFFTDEEWEFYKKVNREKTQKTGLNIRDFMGAERKIEWTEHEALDYIITYVGTATFGKGRWFRQEDGTYYDRLFEDYVDLEEVAKRLVHTVWEREEE